MSATPSRSAAPGLPSRRTGDTIVVSTASCAPCHKVNPSATISSRRPSSALYSVTNLNPDSFSTGISPRSCLTKQSRIVFRLQQRENVINSHARGPAAAPLRAVRRQTMNSTWSNSESAAGCEPLPGSNRAGALEVYSQDW